MASILPASGVLGILIVDDNPVYRAGLRRLLENAPGVSWVEEWDGPAGLLERVADTRPDVVLLDLHLGGQESLAWPMRIRAASPGARILVLTGEDRPGLAQAVRAAGGDACLTKDVPDAVLVAWVVG